MLQVTRYKLQEVGQSLTELLVAIGIAALLLPALLTGFISSREGKSQQLQRIKAVTLLQESEQALRSIRDAGWANISTNGTYYPQISGSSWTLTSGTQSVSGFTRSIQISDVYRDTNGVIVTSGGTLDPSTKKAIITVTWPTPIPSSTQSTVYVTRFENLSYTETTQAQFNGGTINNVSVTNTNGGEIQLSNNTKGQWCQPSLSSGVIDLPTAPKSVWAEPGHVYVGSGTTQQSSTISFTHIAIANTEPPTGTVLGTFKGYATNDVWADTNYGYIATTSNSKEVVVINLNQFADPVNNIYAEQGYFNTNNSSDDAQSIFVMQGRGYVAAGRYLYVFDLSSAAGSRPQIGTRISFANSGDFAGEIYGVTLGGSRYIFVSIEGSTPEELKIINVTNHNGGSSQWGVVGQINIEPNNCSTLESGKSVYIKPDGTRAYISSTNDQSFKEFFAIDTSNKSNPTLVGGLASNPPCTNGGGYEASGMDPEQSVVVSLAENRVVLVGVDPTSGGTNAEEYQVLDLSNEGAPVKCSGLNINQGIFGVSAVKETDGDAYAYLITGDSSNDLKIVQGGPDGTYVETGTYESATFDPGYNTAFNRYTITTTIPAQTTLQFQFASTNSVGGSCSGVLFNFVGPDGTSSTYYTAQQAQLYLSSLGGYLNPGRCFRYKAFFSTLDPNQTPVLNDMSVNYSP